MEGQIDQPPVKYSRSKLSSSYKDQFLQEISSYVHETDFLINNPSNEGNSSNRRAKETMISTENIPPELDDPYHKRSQIPKRPKNQSAAQKKSLIPTSTRTSKKTSRKSDSKKNGIKDNSAIVPLTDDDLTHYFDLATGSISNDESSPLQSPDINQKKRSKSPGPRLNNNRNSISEKQPAKRSKSPSVVRRRVRKMVKSPNKSPNASNSKKKEEKTLTPTINDDFNEQNFMIEEDDSDEERFHTPQNNRNQKIYNTLDDDLITFSAKSKNKSNSPEKRSSTESAGSSPRKIINPPPSRHQQLLEIFNDTINQKKNNRISKSEPTEPNLYPIESKTKNQKDKQNKKKNLSKYSKNLNFDEDYETSDDTEETNENDNKKLTDFDIQKMKSGWTAPNLQGYQNNSSSPISYSPQSTKEENPPKKSNLLDDDKLLSNKSLSSSPKNAFENLRSSDDSEEEINQNNNNNNNKEIQIDTNPSKKTNNDFDLISLSPMKPRHQDDLLLFSENSAKKEANSKRRRIPNSPLTPLNKKLEQEESENNKPAANHLFFVNANSENSESYSTISQINQDKLNDKNQENKNEISDANTQNKNDDDNSKTNSDLMGFTVIEMNNAVPASSPQKLEIIPIEPIDPINSRENLVSPKRVVTDSLIAEFLDFGNNSPQKINNSNEQKETEINETANQPTNENSNLINLSNIKTPEKQNENKTTNNFPNELENSEIVLSCSLLTPTRNAHEEQEKEEQENSHTSIENSNFISFSNVENKPSTDIKQFSPAGSPPKIEILSFLDKTDPNVIPPEKMNLSIFNSPLKPGEDPNNKYKLNSSEILNFSKHSPESQKQSDENPNLSTSSPSLLQTNYEGQQTNKINSNALSEYSEKADSERVDSPDKGNYIDLFKSPNKVSYMNNKKGFKVTLFSEGLSPNNINSISASHAKNMNSSLSSSPASESASESVAVSTSVLSSSSPYKHVRREPKKAITMLNRHFISIEEDSSSGQFASSSILEAAKSNQQKEPSPSPLTQEKQTNTQNINSSLIDHQSEKNNDQSEFNTEYNKFVTGDKNALLKTYENSEANATFNEDEIETDKNKENNDLTVADEIIEEEEVDESFNKDESLNKNDNEEEDINGFNEDENITKTENIINEEEEDFIPNTKESNENQKFEYSIELSSIPTLQSSSKNIDPSNNENEINGSTKAKRLTTEEVNAIQKKVFGNLGYEGETETENETDNYIKFENKNEKDIVENDFKNYRKKKPTSAFMFSQNDYSYSEIDSENNHKNNDINNHNCEEEKIENEKEKESENDNENTLEKEKESENDNENTLENEDEIDNNNESIKDNNNDEESFINTELTEAISNKNFSSQVIHDLVHYVTGVPKHVSKNRNLNGSLNNSGNLNNTSMIDNEDTIFAFQERFVSIIEVEILTNEGETINIFPTNLNDYLIDRNTFLNEEKKEKEVKSIPNKSTKNKTKSENSKKNQNTFNDNIKSPARNKSPNHTSFIKSPSNYNSPYKGPSPKTKLSDKSPSKQSLNNNKHSPSQLAKSPSSKKPNTKKQRDSIESFGSAKPVQQKQQKKGNLKGKQNVKKQQIDIDNENEFENQFENEIENDNANFGDASNDDFISVSTPTKSPKSSRSSTPIKEKSNKKSPLFEEDDQNNEFVNVSTPKKKQQKSLNSPYNKKQNGSNTKFSSNLNKNQNKKAPNSSNSKLSKQTRESQFSHSNNDEPSDLDDFTPVQTQQVTKKINNTASPSPFVGNSTSKPKRIESDSSDSFLKSPNNNSSEVNSSSIIAESNNNFDPDEFVSVSANATPQKTDLNVNTNSSKNKNNTIATKSPLKENPNNKKKQTTTTTRKSLQKKQTTPNSDDFIPQETQNQKQKNSGVQPNLNSNTNAPKKKQQNSGVTRMKPGLLGHTNNNNNNHNNHNINNNQVTNKKETNEQLNHQNPFAKGKNKGLQFSLRKPLKKASAVNKKPPQNNEHEEVFDDEDDENNNVNENIENDANFEQLNEIEDDEQQIQSVSNRKQFYDEKPQNTKKNHFSKPQKQKQNEISPASQPPKSPKTGSNKKKTQLLSPKTIEDPFKALKASKQNQPTNNSNSNGSGRKKKNSFQPISKSNANNNQVAGKRKKAQASSAAGNPPIKKNNTMNETNNEASNSSSSFQLAFNIDTSLFSDATFAKKNLMPQSSPNKKPKTLASVLVAANDDYSEED